MRGKLFLFRGICSPCRITPADAGKTRFRPPTVAKDRDHPRGCGENPIRDRPQERPRGSPPRMRGKRRSARLFAVPYRITPADAGKTQVDRAFGPEVKDHPRGCGENQSLLLVHEHRVGSPPRMRGKRNPTYEDFGEDRITPADAGKTRSRSGHGGVWQDHPRGCGENVAPMSSISAAPGSPPRMRGKH